MSSNQNSIDDVRAAVAEKSETSIAIWAHVC